MTHNLYEIRYYPNLPMATSVSLSPRLVDFKTACKVKRRLKRSKVNAFSVKYKVFTSRNERQTNGNRKIFGYD